MVDLRYASVLESGHQHSYVVTDLHQQPDLTPKTSKSGAWAVTCGVRY